MNLVYVYRIDSFLSIYSSYYLILLINNPIASALMQQKKLKRVSNKPNNINTQAEITDSQHYISPVMLPEGKDLDHVFNAIKNTMKEINCDLGIYNMLLSTIFKYIYCI